MKKILVMVFLTGLILLTGGCGMNQQQEGTGTVSVAQSDTEESAPQEADENENTAAVRENADQDVQETSAYVTEGTEEYRGFILDNVLHSENDGDIHFNLYVPDSYDGSRPYAVFFTLPGYEGLYFQGVGENLYSENFGFTAREYNPEMIIVAPQLEDWGETSADQTIALVEYFLDHYNIDPDKVYGEGYFWGKDQSFLPPIFSAAPSGTAPMSR